METKKYNITLTIPATLLLNKDFPNISTESMEKSITKDRWDEGRYPFSYELFVRALNDILRMAAYDAVLEANSIIFGKTTMVVHNNSKYNKAYLETDNWMKNNLLGFSASYENWQVSITPKQENRDDTQS